MLSLVLTVELKTRKACLPQNECPFDALALVCVGLNIEMDI